MEDGEAVTSFTTTVMTPTPTAALSQNRPNPFNPTTQISYTLDSTQHAHLAVFDISGQLVRTLVTETKAAGTYHEVWDGLNGSGDAVTSGVYFFRLKAGTKTFTRKALLLK